jgi:hypothetical protein
MEMAMPNDLTEAELLENIEAFRKGQKVFVSEMYHVAIDEVCDLAIEGLAARRWPTDGIEQSFQSNFDSPATQARGEAVSETYLTVQDVLDAHAEVGQLDYHLVKKPHHRSGVWTCCRSSRALRETNVAQGGNRQLATYRTPHHQA